MVTARTLPLIPLVGFCVLSSTPLLPASGGWYDESPPATLSRDLDRLPAKTLGEIILETVEEGKFEVADVVAKDAVTPDDLEPIIQKIGKAKPEELAKEIDALVMKARLQYVRHGGVLNDLYDIRDAITAKGPQDSERKRYCAARPDYDMKVQENIDPDTYAAGEPMRPHLLYLQGAALFTDGRRANARPWFDEILKKFPDHPRAETASFLAARCTLSMSLTDVSQRKPEEQKKLHDEAVQSFRDCLKKYPQGRYVADVHGWLGALLWEEHPAEALEHYIAQLEDPAHPECRKSAAHMVEMVLSKVMGSPEENGAMFKVVAQHPRIAQAAVYLVLNAPEIDPYDGKYDEPADLKKWKQVVLPKLASAVSAEESRYWGSWAPRLRAMLAQAASNAGQQEEALKLTAAPDAELKKSDDLMFARIVALQRARQPKEVAKLGQLFLDTFEKSQLRAGVSLRLALALVDEHRAGEAYVMLSKMEPALAGEGNDGLYPSSEEELGLEQSWVYPDTDGANAFNALKATILNFTPLKELQAVLGSKAWDEKPDALVNLKKALAVRKEALEDFTGASALTDDEAIKERLGKLEKLAQAVNKASGKAKAQAMMVLGNAFEEESEKAFVVDADRRQSFPDEEWNDLNRRDDARALGCTDPDTELENRNLMRHATRWWLRAARSAAGSDLSAKARLKVLEGLEKTARMSDYDFTRAMETNLAQVSRDIYNILLKENPKSPEARDAAYWNFVPCPPAPKPKEGEDTWVPPYKIRGQEDSDRELEKASLLGGYHALPYKTFGEFESLAETENESNDTLVPFFAVLTAASAKPATLNHSLPLEKVTDAFNKTFTAAENAEQIKLPNLFEDLMLFQKVPGLTDEARSEYIRLRLRVDNYPDFKRWENKPDLRPSLKSLLEHARANPALASVQDFVDYAELYANEADRGPDGAFQPVYPTYAEVEKGCRAFLLKYPRSPRREACSLLLIRAIYRQLPERFGHPEKKDGTIDENVIEESKENFRPAPLIKAIAEYEKEFPKMRYDAEVRNFRGIIAWRKSDYGTALDLTLAQLDDMTHRDLRREAAVRLANLFADLRDARHRTAVLGALKTRPAALAKLKLSLDEAPKNAGHPLRNMRKYLGDQLGFE